MCTSKVTLPAPAPILGLEYDYVAGAVLMRVSGLLSPTQAKTYETPLAQATGGGPTLIK